MNVFALLGIIFLLALMIEALVEAIFGQVFSHVESLKPYSWALMYVAMVAGCIGAYIYQLDFVSLLGEWLGQPMPVNLFGVILTGLTIGRGSNAVHDLIMEIFTKNEWRKSYLQD